MKTLLILRHAKSSWDDPRLDDHQRPLNARGQRDAPRIGQLLKNKKLVPDQVIASTAVRALETARAVTANCDYPGDIQTCERYYHAAPQDYLEELKNLPADCQRVLIVGHNPGLEGLVEQLAGQYHRLPTAALAQFDLSITRWPDVKKKKTAQLVHLWRPKEL